MGSSFSFSLSFNDRSSRSTCSSSYKRATTPRLLSKRSAYSMGYFGPHH
jgi:hypothetical protein